MISRRIAGISVVAGFALLAASSAIAQVSVPRVHAAPVRSQTTARPIASVPVTMKRVPPASNQSAKSSLAADRADAQMESQRLQRPPLGSLAHPTRPHVIAERPQLSKVGVVGGRR